MLTLSADYLRIRGLLEFGGVPKRPTGADCKSAGYAFVGSNPTPSTIFWWGRALIIFSCLAGMNLFWS